MKSHPLHIAAFAMAMGLGLMAHAQPTGEADMKNADARSKPTAAAQRKSLEVRADADYKLAKKQCQDQMGSARDTCLKDAKTAHTTARANARTPMNSTGADVSKSSGGDKGTKGEGPNEATEKREAQYKMDAEKCESMAGAAKTNCQAEAKARAGK